MKGDNKNKYGLSRDIPDPIARQIRKNSGFGCVVCGKALAHYEHVDPPFIDAKEHDPDKMTLLCGGCHDEVTRGFQTKEKVKEAMKAPFCKRTGFSWGALNIGRGYPTFKVSVCTFVNCRIPIQMYGVPLIEIIKAEEEGEPMRINANFQNSKGEPSLQIIDNVLRAYEDNWDVEVTGGTKGTIIIRDKSRRISLKLVVTPPKVVTIEQIDMYVNGVRLRGNKNNIELIHPNFVTTKIYGLNSIDCPIGISL